jgi:hypothetical protein
MFKNLLNKQKYFFSPSTNLTKIRKYTNLTKSTKFFCEKIRKEEIHLYVMHDKYSVKPDKEFRINHQTLESFDKDKKNKKMKVMEYGK